MNFYSITPLRINNSDKHPMFYSYQGSSAQRFNVPHVMRKMTKPHMMLYDFDFVGKSNINFYNTHTYIELIYENRNA